MSGFSCMCPDHGAPSLSAITEAIPVRSKARHRKALRQASPHHHYNRSPPTVTTTWLCFLHQGFSELCLSFLHSLLTALYPQFPLSLLSSATATPESSEPWGGGYVCLPAEASECQRHGLWNQALEVGSNPYSAHIIEIDKEFSLVKMLSHFEPRFPPS